MGFSKSVHLCMLFCTNITHNAVRYRRGGHCGNVFRTHTLLGWHGVLGQGLRVQEDLRETHHPHPRVTPPGDIPRHDIIAHHHGVESHTPHSELVVQRKFVQTLGARLHTNVTELQYIHKTPQNYPKYCTYLNNFTRVIIVN